MHRRRKQSGRRFERPERVCDKRSLSCPLSENRRPIPTEVPCGHFWHHLLVTKGGKTTSSRRTRRPQACTTALRKARRKRRQRHPRLFAVLDLSVLLGQAKSTKKMIAGFRLHETAALQRRAGRSLRQRRPATKARTPQASPHIPYIAEASRPSACRGTQ